MPPDSFQRWFIYLCSFGSIALLVYWVHATYADLAAKASIGEERRRAISSFLLLHLAPAAGAVAQWLGPRIDRLEMEWQTTGHTSFLVALRRRIENMLVAAGRPHGLSPNEFLGIWIVARLIFMVLGVGCYAMLLHHFQGIPALLVVPLFVIFALLLEIFGLSATVGVILLLFGVAYYFPLLYYWPGRLSAIILVFVAVGYFLPWNWLRDLQRKRQRWIRRDLPYALDLLTLSVEAGLDFTAALARIVRRRPGTPLSQELGETLRQVQMGVPRADAIRDLSDRVHMEEVSSVTSALIQADELGASLGPVLRVQAEAFRVRRAQAGEKAANESTVKLLFPLICFFFPIIFIVIFGPWFVGLVLGP